MRDRRLILRIFPNKGQFRFRHIRLKRDPPVFIFTGTHFTLVHLYCTKKLTCFWSQLCSGFHASFYKIVRKTKFDNSVLRSFGSDTVKSRYLESSLCCCALVFRTRCGFSLWQFSRCCNTLSGNPRIDYLKTVLIAPLSQVQVSCRKERLHLSLCDVICKVVHGRNPPPAPPKKHVQFGQF